MSPFADRSSDATVNLSQVTQPIDRGGSMMAPDNLTTTRVITPVRPNNTELNKLYFVNQGIKGARFLCIVMLAILAFYVLWTATDMMWEEWLLISTAAALLGLGAWEGSAVPEQKLGTARSHRRIVVYFAVTGTVLALTAFGSHALIWWVTAGQFLL